MIIFGIVNTKFVNMKHVLFANWTISEKHRRAHQKNPMTRHLESRSEPYLGHQRWKVNFLEHILWSRIHRHTYEDPQA